MGTEHLEDHTTLLTKFFKLMQGNDTKLENLDKYFEEKIESAPNRVDQKCENIRSWLRK